MTGRTLSHYRILEKLGEGGMGVVYKALDTHLNRSVAIKVLPAEAVGSPERKQRFAQEAKAASALNHPNIIHVYDVDTADGVDFIAMEYVEGKTVADLAGRTGIPLRDALKYAVEIARGLAAAHAAGIIHRDIKPGNVMVSEKGFVKILDFGLAKLSEPEEENAFGSTRTMQPRTEEGAILGTVAYMSPEQAEGKKIDARSDVFSFGATLYEMLTGRRAFQGQTRLSTLTAILHKEPPSIREIAKAVPPELESLIARCLRKDPARRLHSMDDVRLLLEDLLEAPAPAPVAASGAKWRKWWRAIALMAGSLATGIAVALLWRPSAASDFSSYSLKPFATEAGEENEPAWSPDGKTLAYMAETDGIAQIYTRSLDAPTATRVTSSSSDCHVPFWSADGARIYYLGQSDLWSIGAAGGIAQLAIKDVHAASISPDGRGLVFSRGFIGANGLWIASPPDADPRPYRQSPFPENAASLDAPQFSPDGYKIAVAVSRQAGGAAAELWIVPYPSGTPRKTAVHLPAQGSSFRPFSWMPDSRHIVAGGGIADAGGHLYLVDTEAGSIRPLTKTTGGESNPAVSPDGRQIAFASGADDFDLVEIDVDGGRPRTLLTTSRTEWMPTWSLAGNQYAYVTNANKDWEIWMRSTQEGSARPLVKRDSGLTWDFLRYPRFSPDGRRISYDIVGPKHVVAVSSVAGGRPVVLDPDSTDHHGASWSPDGNWIAYRRLIAGKWELVKVSLGGGRPISLGETSEGGSPTDWSPNGEWICHRRGGLLHLVSSDGKVSRAVKTEAAAFGFSRDSAWLYAVRRNSKRRWELAAMTVPGGEEGKVTQLDIPPSSKIEGFSPHPNGRSFATSVGVARYDIWVLEGFAQPRRWFFRR